MCAQEPGRELRRRPGVRVVDFEGERLKGRNVEGWERVETTVRFTSLKIRKGLVVDLPVL